MHGMTFPEAARTPARKLLALKELRRSIDAEARLERLADLGSLFGGAAAKRHLNGLTSQAAGPSTASPVLKMDEGGKTVEGAPFVLGRSYVTG
ncbi:MAG: hypothetical protein LBR80_06935 [Deltaproteobacteria bacterium]|jgi:hypothetical protein|nr:hypothetical protein [Deltaproteobacteria bacterium]